MSETNLKSENGFNPYVFFEFLDKTVLGEERYVSIRDFSRGFHLGVVRRTGKNAIEVILSFHKGETKLVKRSLKDEEVIIVRGEILIEAYSYPLNGDVLLECLDENYRMELLNVLDDLEYAFMGTELDF